MASESSTKLTLKETSTPPVQAKGPSPKHRFEGRPGAEHEFIFLHDNVHILIESDDGMMRKWNCDTGLLVGEPWKVGSGGIYALALSPDGKTIAMCLSGGSIELWTPEGEMIKGNWMSYSGGVASLSWSPSGNHLATGSDDGKILIQDADREKVKVGPIETKHGRVTILAYSPSGDRIASAGCDNTVCIWDSKTGNLVVGPFEDFDVSSVVWSSDSSKLYIVFSEVTIGLDSTSGATLDWFYQYDSWYPPVVYSIALSPTHNVLACVGWDLAQLWNTESNQPLGEPFDEDGERLLGVSFSRDGRYLACNSEHGKVALWLVKDIAPELAATTQQETQPESPSLSSTPVFSRLSSPLLTPLLQVDVLNRAGHHDSVRLPPYKLRRPCGYCPHRSVWHDRGGMDTDLNLANPG